MGQVLGVVGGFIASYGSAILSAASVAASLAMAFIPRPGLSLEGPRINDATVMTSTFGNAIPKIIGRCRVAGNIIWATDIEEVKTTRKVGGKGSMFGGSSAKQTTYSYYGNYAVAFGKGNGDGCFAKIFADKKLIYDATGGSEAFFKYPEAAIRFYTGGSDQQADPLIEADVGAGEVPAHRDLTYVVIENLPLLDFGNRIPQTEAEFDSSTEAEYSKELTTTITGWLTDWFPQMIQYDKTTRQLYVANGAFFGGPGNYAAIGRIDMGANEMRATVKSTSPGPPYLWDDILMTGFGFIPEGIFPYEDGKVFVAGTIYSYNGGWAKINPYTLNPITIKSYCIAPGCRTGNFKDEAAVSFTRQHPTKISNYSLFPHDPGGTAIDPVPAKIMVFDRDDELISASTIVGRTSLVGDEGFEILGGCVDRDGVCWISGVDWSIAADGSGRRAVLLRVEINRTANVPGLGDSAEISTEIIDVAPLGVHYPVAIAYDHSTHSVIFGSNKPDDSDLIVWVRWGIEERAVLASRTFDENVAEEQYYRLSAHGVPSFHNGTNGGYLVLRSAGPAGNKMLRLRTVDLTFEELEKADGDRYYFMWDPTQNQAWFFTSDVSPPGTTPQLVQWDRCTETPVPLEDVITELVELTRELTASDIDVTDAGITAQDLRGLIISRQMPVRRALESLVFPYQLDIVESDGVLKFLTRGGGSARTIAENDLGATTQGQAEEKLLIDRSQEAEVPFRMDIRYLDWDREFLEGNQSAQRQLHPFPTQFSPEVAQINVPIAMTSSEAAKAVEAGLYNAWVGRTQFQFGLGTKHVDLDPTDVVTVQKDAESYVMRIMEWQLEDGFTSVLRAISDDAETYVSYAEGQQIATPAQTFGPPGATELFILDIPLLRDVDDPNQLGTGVYVGFGRHQANWRGSVAERSISGGARWDRFSTSRDSTPWGYLEADVAALTRESDNTYPSEILILDETTEVDVQVVADADDLESITRLELWNTQENAFVIGEGDAAEILRFQDVQNLGGGTYRFTNLLRGRRGTEEAALVGHTEGTRVVFLSEYAINREGLDLDRITRTDFYRAASLGEFVEAARILASTLQANDLRPYAVCRPEPSVEAGGSRTTFDITWTRRTRVGGNMDLLDGIQQDEVPVGEDEESYEVDLLDKVTGEPVSPVLTSTDDATGVTISSGHFSSAGYSAGDAVTVRIYQISAIVGRGYPLEVTL